MERNITIDYLRLFLSILVITIHVQPLFHADTEIGWLISNGLARIAVPCFFIINGYFLGDKILSWKSTSKYITKLLIIYAVWVLIYFYNSTGWDLKMSVIIFSFGYSHLWYIVALIVGTLLLFVANKIIRNQNVLFVICILLFLTGATLQSIMDINSVIDLFKTRNALFVGLPFIFLGNYIKTKKNDIEKIGNKTVLSLLALSIAILLLESYICFTNNSGKDLYYSLITVCPLLFIFTLKHSKHSINDGYIGLLASGIYFTHILAMGIVNSIFPHEELKIHILPLIVFLSMIISVVVIQLNKRIKIFL